MSSTYHSPIYRTSPCSSLLHNTLFILFDFLPVNLSSQRRSILLQNTQIYVGYQKQVWRTERSRESELFTRYKASSVHSWYFTANVFWLALFHKKWSKETNSFELWVTLKAGMEDSAPGQVKTKKNPKPQPKPTPTPQLDPLQLDFRDFQYLTNSMKEWLATQFLAHPRLKRKYNLARSSFLQTLQWKPGLVSDSKVFTDNEVFTDTSRCSRTQLFSWLNYRALPPSFTNTTGNLVL